MQFSPSVDHISAINKVNFCRSHRFLLWFILYKYISYGIGLIHSDGIPVGCVERRGRENNKRRELSAH